MPLAGIIIKVLATYAKDLGNLIGKCKRVVTVPYKGQSRRDMESVQRKGLVLQGIASDWSSHCVHGGGRCVYSLQAQCFCPQGPSLLWHTTDCPSVSPSSFPPVLALSLPIAYALLVFVTFAKNEVIWSLKAGIYCEISPVD